MEDLIEIILILEQDKTYLIPKEMENEFYGTPEFKRQREFARYILPYEGLLECLYIENSELQRLVDGEI